MSDLVTWLLAQIDADEAVARAATPGPWGCADEHGNWPGATPAWCINELRDGKWVGDIACMTQDDMDEPNAHHIARHDPARVLADCEALRAVVAALVDAEDMIERIGPDLDKPGDAAEWANYHAWREAVELLAQPFAGRPGWRDEWGTNGHKEAQG